MGRRGPRRGTQDAGFSLVEVAVLGFILLILAFVAITVYLNQRDQAVRVSAVTTIDAVTTEANQAWGTAGAGYPLATDLAAETQGREIGFVDADAPSTSHDVVSYGLRDDAGTLIVAVLGGPWCYYLRTAGGGEAVWRHHASRDEVDCTADEFTEGVGDGW